VRFGEIEKIDDLESTFYHGGLLKRLIGSVLGVPPLAGESEATRDMEES
jgi:hypothetical protein